MRRIAGEAQGNRWMFDDSTQFGAGSQISPRSGAPINWLRRRLISSRVIWFCWMANLLSACWFCVWIFNDGMFGDTVRLFPAHVQSLFRRGAELSAPDFANRFKMLCQVVDDRVR